MFANNLQLPAGLVIPTLTPALPRAILATIVPQEPIPVFLLARITVSHQLQSAAGPAIQTILPALPKPIQVTTVLREHIPVLLLARITVRLRFIMY